jgi:CRP-like cAMP-binding protein
MEYPDSIPAGTISKDVDISPLIHVMNQFHPLSPGIISFIEKHVVGCTVSKKKMLLKAGSMCYFIYFIRKGAVRGFIKEGTKDITTWITVEGEMVSSISSLDMKAPASENMQAIENCELYALSFRHLNELYEQFPEFNIAIRKLLQQYYADAERRAFIARLTKAENKYRHFLVRYSHLTNRIPLKYIASFLGITLETLSRVRKSISGKGVKKNQSTIVK